VVTILVADDSANIRAFLKEALEEDGYRVLLARDGRDAVDLAQLERPDLAILDILMPQLNGLEVAQRVVAIDPNIRVILFTNNDDLCMSDPRSAFAAACIEKGSDFAELKQAITSVLNSRKGKTLMRAGLPPIQGRPAAEPRCGWPATALPALRSG
jgi:CheY-like chemotaxis protein